jgi:hypothetical protein
MVYCIFDCHSTMVSLNWAIRPVVDRRETLFPQSESANPSRPVAPPLRYVSLKLGFASRYPITWCRAAHCAGPADAQNLASCEAVKARSHYLIHDAANCSLATKERYTFCSRGSGVSGHMSCSRTTPGCMGTCFGFTNFLIAALYSDSVYWM